MKNKIDLKYNLENFGLDGCIYDYLYNKEFKETFFKNKNPDIIQLMDWGLEQSKKYPFNRLLSNLGKWHLGLGFKDKAKEIYEKIDKEMVEKIEKSPKIKIDFNARAKKLSNPKLLIPNYRNGELLSKIEKAVEDIEIAIEYGGAIGDPNKMVYLGNYDSQGKSISGIFLPNEQTGWFDTPEEFKSHNHASMTYLNEPEDLRKRALKWSEKYYGYHKGPKHKKIESELTIERLKIGNDFLDYLINKVENI